MSKIRTCLLWFTLTIVHTFLFFGYAMGVNGLIYSVLTISIVTWYHGLYREKFWWMAVAGHLLIAISAAWHSIIGIAALYNLTFIVLTGYIFSARSSLPVAFLNGLAGTVLLSFLRTLRNGFRLLQTNFQDQSGFSIFKRMPLYVAPISVTAIFYMLYGAANPDFFLEINFPDWGLNYGLITYTIVGAIIICPLFFSLGVKPLTEFDLERSNVLNRIRVKRNSATPLRLLYENKQGVIMFVMLNLLIASFLIFNITQIFLPSLNHSAADYSQQVHQGFETLVISMIVAMLLIMFYFRGNQNFYSRKEKLVKLAVIWIALNGALILFTCYKNVLYINSFGLTYKRIWVFIGMFLTAIGLYLTLVKIYKLKTNWFLIRQNTWVIYFVISSYFLVDWNRLITWYNPNHAEFLDMEYILSLDKTQLPYLNKLLKAGDPRVIPYQTKIQDKIKNIQMQFDLDTPSKWQEETLDKSWLRSELNIK